MTNIRYGTQYQHVVPAAGGGQHARRLADGLMNYELNSRRAPRYSIRLIRFLLQRIKQVTTSY